MNEQNKRCLKRAAIEDFVPPSSKEDLMNRVLQELREEADGGDDKDGLGIVSDKSLLWFLEKECRSAMPCATQQQFQAIVQECRAFLVVNRQDEDIVIKMEKKKHSVAALMDLGAGSIQMKLHRGTADSNVRPQAHEEASGQTQDFKLHSIPLSDDDMIKIPSAAMTKIWKNDGEPINYSNEASIQAFVSDILIDAVDTCNAILNSKLGKNEKFLHCTLEQSLWSDRPDHAVVFDSRAGIPLLTTESKKPIVYEVKQQKRARQKDAVVTKYPPKLIDFPRVRGQGYNYLRSMQFLGHQQPIHVTTTVNETYVAWLEGNVSVEVYNKTKNEDVKDLWEKAATNISARHLKNDDSLTQSPLIEKSRNARISDDTTLSTVQRKAQIRKGRGLKEKKLKRLILHSETFEAHKLFHVFVNCILCSILGSYSAAVIPTLETDNILEDQVALKLTSKSYEWVLVDAIVKGPLPVGNWTTTVYAVSSVGVGSSSKAFRIITKDRYEGVAKIYMLKHDESNMIIEKEKFIKNAWCSINAEYKVFRATYPQLPVHKVILHEHPGLLMPYFRPVQPQLKWKDAVIEQLKNLKNRKSSLRYQPEDVRWRHVGLHNDNLYLFDFNNMKTIE
jgi:hypothetical protein